MSVARPLQWIRLLLAVSVCAASATGAAAPLTPTQALSYIRVGDLQLSADGKQLVMVVSSYQWDARPRLRLVDIDSGMQRELTPAGKSERSPQWSPDGGTIAFLSNRGGETMQLYLLPLAGGEATAVTAGKFAVERFHWSPDGRSIAYLAKDDSAPDQHQGPQVADQEANLARLWLLDVKSRATRRIGASGYRIADFQWQSPASLLVVATDTPRVEEFTDRLFSVAVADGVLRPAARPPQPFDTLLVSPDGRQFAVRSTAGAGPIARNLFIGTPGGALHPLLTTPDLAVAEARWHEQGVFWLRLVDGFCNRIFRVGVGVGDGASATPLELPLSVAGFDVARNGTLVFAGEDFRHLPEVYVRDGKGAIRQLTHLQQGWDGISLAATEIFRTRAADGLQIEAALMAPAAAAQQAPHKAPLVLLVHGGPASNFTSGYGWETAWAQLLAAHGYQVLMVNPRGSSGYSEDFVKANRADWGGADFADLMAVLDAVVARGGTDASRLGIGGWSYGGEMAAWAITRTQRFRAAVVGAGVFDQQAEFETESNPAGDEWYFGTPWEQPQVFARNSPATYIRAARTPTLILAGEDDASNPVGQSKGLYRALKHFGVDTVMVLYPGEGHSPRRWDNNLDMFERILAWYDRHLQ